MGCRAVIDGNPEQELPFSAAFCPHWHTEPRKCPFHNGCSSWFSPGSIHSRQDLKDKCQWEMREFMHKQEIFALDGKCQKKQEIIYWVCGFVFFFFLQGFFSMGFFCSSY